MSVVMYEKGTWHLSCHFNYLRIVFSQNTELKEQATPSHEQKTQPYKQQAGTSEFMDSDPGL